MATRSESIAPRSRVYAALIALALMLAVALVITQASSVWSTRPVQPAQPAQPARPAAVHVSLSPKELRWLSQQTSHLPKGCRIKYGCDRGTTSGQG